MKTVRLGKTGLQVSRKGMGGSERTIPIPGFKTMAQVEENAGALEFGPLNDEQMQKINRILERES